MKHDLGVDGDDGVGINPADPTESRKSKRDGLARGLAELVVREHRRRQREAEEARNVQE